MCKNLNVQVLNIAVERPWQNGVYEYNPALFDRCIKKIIEDKPETSLPGALSNAKYPLQCGQAFHRISLYLAVIPIFHQS